ncbi:MAG: SRPBCC family protein [Actinomycetota bacterium]
MGGKPVVIDTAIAIAAPPEIVWPYLVDWENLSRWMKEGSGFEVTSQHREGVGVTAVAKIRIAGIVTQDPVRVTRWTPPTTLEIEHLGWVGGAGLMTCSAQAPGTHLAWRETLRPPWGPIGALGLRPFKPLMRRVFARDLRLLKELVESSSPAGAL